MAFALGYNIKRAEELTQEIARAYQDLSGTISSNWDQVVSSLQTNWVGEDEQSFEATFAKKINQLYQNANLLAKGAIQTIVGLAESWHSFQQTNVLENGEIISGAAFSMTGATIQEAGDIVAYRPVEFSADIDRGLKDQNSADQIKTTVESYVNEVKSKATNLFNEIDTNSAFFGEQTTAIKTYIEKTGEAISEVTVAVKDLYNALDTLANTSYVTSTSTVSQEMGNAANEIENSLSELANSRWTSN